MRQGWQREKPEAGWPTAPSRTSRVPASEGESAEFTTFLQFTLNTMSVSNAKMNTKKKCVPSQQRPGLELDCNIRPYFDFTFCFIHWGRRGGAISWLLA